MKRSYMQISADHGKEAHQIKEKIVSKKRE